MLGLGGMEMGATMWASGQNRSWEAAGYKVRKGNQGTAFGDKRTPKVRQII